MSAKKDLIKELRVIEEEIKLLEVKRARSQSALIEALISRRDPDEEEMQYFRTYNSQIEVKREQLIKITEQLEEISQ